MCLFLCYCGVCVCVLLSFIDLLSYYLGLRKGIGIYICVYNRICIFHSLRFYIFPLIIQCWFVFSSFADILVSILDNRLSIIDLGRFSFFDFGFSLYWGNFWHMCLVRFVCTCLYVFGFHFVLFSFFFFWYFLFQLTWALFIYLLFKYNIFCFFSVEHLTVSVSVALKKIEERVATSGGKTWLEIESTIVIVFGFSCLPFGFVFHFFGFLYLENYKDFFVRFFCDFFHSNFNFVKIKKLRLLKMTIKYGIFC